jgi:hypothetical protein
VQCVSSRKYSRIACSLPFSPHSNRLSCNVTIIQNSLFFVTPKSVHLNVCVCVWLYENRNRVVLLLLSFVIRSLQRHQTFQVGVSIASKLFSLFLLSVYLFMLIQNFVFVK